MQPNVLENRNGRAPAAPIGRADFEEMIVAARKRVYDLALRKLGNRSDAEDATQETLARAWSGRAGYDPARSFDAWISRIAANLCIDWMRRRRRRIEVSLDTPLQSEPDCEGVSVELADLTYNPERLLL